MPGEIRIGTSGWIYRDWRGRYYPENLPVKKWFEYYTQDFNTVELNNTFYRLGNRSIYEGWRQQAPPKFVYAVKCNRYLTHNLKLSHAEESLRRFFDFALLIKPRLGPVLYQLPPHWRVNVERLKEFCGLLPKRVKHVLEFREPSWLCDAVFEVLTAHGIGLCIHDLLPNHPRLLTAPVGYVRFHGAGGKYRGSYPVRQIKHWAAWLKKAAASGNKLYVYFNNDIEAAAIHDAKALLQWVKE